MNDNLDNFLGVVFLFYIDRWSIIINTIWRIENVILGGMVIAGIFGGFTLQLAILVDIVSFFSFHITCFYTSSSRIYMLQLNVLSSLWKLFRGKRIDDKLQSRKEIQSIKAKN